MLFISVFWSPLLSDMALLFLAKRQDAEIKMDIALLLWVVFYSIIILSYINKASLHLKKLLIFSHLLTLIEKLQIMIIYCIFFVINSSQIPL